jgi:hypothetical protein
MKHSSMRFFAAVPILVAAAALAADASAGGVHWTVPANWQGTAERPMRVATYTIPAAAGQEAGECGVFYFGQGQGGSVDDNFARWAGQFEAASTPKKSVSTINGMKVHQIDLSGTYLAPGGPMMKSQGKKAGWRLLGAIVEAPDGLVFFKCIGPAATIAKAEKDFAGLLKSLTKGAKA